MNLEKEASFSPRCTSHRQKKERVDLTKEHSPAQHSHATDSKTVHYGTRGLSYPRALSTSKFCSLQCPSQSGKTREQLWSSLWLIEKGLLVPYDIDMRHRLEIKLPAPELISLATVEDHKRQ